MSSQIQNEAESTTISDHVKSVTLKGDFAQGERTQPPTSEGPDFARGERTELADKAADSGTP